MSHGIVSVCGWLVLFFAMTSMTGCSKGLAQDSTAGRTGSDYPLLLETYGEDERDALRIKRDTARGRLWVLSLRKSNHVRVYDTANKKLIRQITLPSWFVIEEATCMPDLILDRSGSAFISSNVQARLWRIDADSFEVRVHEFSLRGREEREMGFGALAFTRKGALYALTSTADSLWNIDVATASANMIEAYHPPSKVCALTTQFLDRLERSRKAWIRPID